MFVNLKAIFDSIDKAMLLREIRMKGVKEGLIERTAEVLRETRSRIKAGES